PEHHPEGDAWNHTLLVVDTAAKLKELSKNPLIFMWAALLHDIGKPRTTKIRKGKITSYDHDKVGEKLAIEFLESLVDDHEFIDEVTNLVRYHMHILFVIRNLPYADRKGLLKKTDVREVALLGYCDRMGRTNQDKRQVRKDIEQFYHIMTK
ncbi:HD domain-containing protein, partial [Anaerosporobacter sp.]